MTETTLPTPAPELKQPQGTRSPTPGVDAPHPDTGQPRRIRPRHAWVVPSSRTESTDGRARDGNRLTPVAGCANRSPRGKGDVSSSQVSGLNPLYGL